MGCSTHSVPSWSNSAIRSSLGTNFGLDLSVVECTKSRIAFFAAPSFQDGSGSSAAADTPPNTPNAVVAADALSKSLRVVFIQFLLSANYCATSRATIPDQAAEQSGVAMPLSWHSDRNKSTVAGAYPA